MAGPRIEVVDDRLRVTIEGWDKFWALKRGFDIPLSHVRTAERAAAGVKPRGIRGPGTAVPGLY